MTPVLLERIGTNPSVLSFNVRGDDGKLVKSKDDKGKMKTVTFYVFVATMWGKFYLLRKTGWSDPMVAEQDAIDLFFTEVGQQPK